MESLTPTTSFADTSDAISENEEDVASRWWEAKAQRKLESTFSLKDIQLICKYVPFNNPNAASLALSKQPRPRLDTLWMSAHFKYNKNWSSNFKVTEDIYFTSQSVLLDSTKAKFIRECREDRGEPERPFLLLVSPCVLERLDKGSIGLPHDCCYESAQ